MQINIIHSATEDARKTKTTIKDQGSLKTSEASVQLIIILESVAVSLADRSRGAC